MSASVFCCPLCGGALTDRGAALACPQGHHFDRAAQGYVNLLPVQRKRAKTPGDSPEMAAARRRFLDTGAYAPFRDSIAALLCSYLKDVPSPVVCDAGCGEGYYAEGMRKALQAAGHTPRVVGFDIAKSAVRAAAGRYKGLELAVAGSFAIPLAAGSCDALTAIFSPIAEREFARVVRPGGLLLLAVAGERHLWELKEILYERPYENRHRKTEYPGFVFESRTPVRTTVTLASREQIADLFLMTPYFWRTPAAGAARLAALDTLTVALGFDLLCYRRTQEAVR